jgi:hypothetical protein
MGGFDDRNVRAQLLLTPSDQFSILASAHARDYDGTSTLFLRGALTKGSNKTDVPRDKVAYDEADNNPQAYKTYGGSVKAVTTRRDRLHLDHRLRDHLRLQPWRHRRRRRGELPGQRRAERLRPVDGPHPRPGPVDPGIPPGQP